MGAHATLGHAWTLKNNSTMEVYGQYLWNRRNGADVKLSSGEPVSFGAVDSSRVRLGARYSRQSGARTSWYAGAAWEFEFGGRSEATIYNQYKVNETPENRGSTFLGELGLVTRPSPDSPWTIDLGIRGYAGKREGLEGRLELVYRF
jgi:outer membrane autotransporter protein